MYSTTTSFSHKIQRNWTTVPFLRLLFPLILGVIVQYYWHISAYAYLLFPLALLLMLLSYMLKHQYRYRLRWLFGLGIYLFLFSIAVVSTSFRQNESAFEFSSEKHKYVGVITDTPQLKEKSITCRVQLNHPNKKIVCYIQKGVRSRALKAGDEIELDAKIGRIKHFGDPDSFDYPAYMYNKGFSGSVYLFSDDWEATGKKSSSLYIRALECRDWILNFYQSLGLDENASAILSALTLGYKDSLSDDLRQAFRTTGTAHVLAVSGMHVGIIYGVIVGFLGFFFKRARFNWRVQVLVVFCLWFYAFITGLPPSVIRACIMLTMFCFANMIGRRGNTYNNIGVAAFFMLLYNPFYLFDLGFQLSFIAVLAICFIQPILRNMLNVRNKQLKNIWSFFTLSVAAQIGTMPVCLYDFGVFPTYFFVSNIVIIPMVTLLVYLAILLVACKGIAFIFPESIAEIVYFIPLNILKLLIKCLTEIAFFFERLPFALIDDIKTTRFTTFLLLAAIISFFMFVKYRYSRLLIVSLSFVLLIIIGCIIPPDDSVSIYRQDGKSAIKCNVGHYSYCIDSVPAYNFISINDKRILSVSSNYWMNKQTENKMTIDYLHIVNADSLSLYSLTGYFIFKRVILDASLSGRNRNRLINECKKLSVPYYDTSEKGFFRINF